MDKVKRLMEDSLWERLRGKLGLVLMGGAMLSKSLIQFCVNGRGCVPSLWFVPNQHFTFGDCWTLTGESGSVSYGVTAPFSWVLLHTRFCLCPPRVCFPVLSKFCSQIPLPPTSNSLGALNPFARSPGWEICCGSQNFLTV